MFSNVQISSSRRFQPVVTGLAHKLLFHSNFLPESTDFSVKWFGNSTVSECLGTWRKQPYHSLHAPQFGNCCPFLLFLINVGNLGSSSVCSFQAVTSTYYKMASIYMAGACTMYKHHNLLRSQLADLEMIAVAGGHIAAMLTRSIMRFIQVRY